MPDYVTRKISEFTEAVVTPFVNSFLDILDNGVNKRLSLTQLRTDILDDAVLTGESTCPTPNPGEDSQRVVNAEWVQDELAGLGLNPATAADYGTVRTNSTDAVPTVYLVSEVDALVSATKPVEEGGTGATTPSTARSNLGAAASGSNNDITALQALASIPTVVNTQLASQSNRITTLESQNLNTRLSTAESDINAVESVNTAQNSRLTSAESDITSILNLSGIVQGFWSSLTAPANSSSTQFLIGSLGSATASIPGWSSANISVNTIISVPVTGTYQLNAAVRLGVMTSNSTSKYRLSFMRQPNGSSTWTDQEFFGFAVSGGGGSNPQIDELWITGAMLLSLSSGDAVRLGVLTSVNTGTVNASAARFWLRRVS